MWIKYHLKLQSIAMALYKSHDQNCSGKGYVANFEIGLVLAEIIGGLSREVIFSGFFYVFVSVVTILICTCAAICCTYNKVNIFIILYHKIKILQWMYLKMMDRENILLTL